MPSPTEQVSSETLTSSSLPLKDNMETSQENVSHVDPDDGDEVTNFDNNKVHEEQQQQQQQQQPQQQPQPQPQPQPQQPQQPQQQENTTTSATTPTNVATFETSSSPSHMTDSAIVNEVANATTTSVASTTSPIDSNVTPTTAQDTTQDIPLDNLSHGTTKPSNEQKRKYNKRPTNEPPRRRTRNTSKSSITTISTQEDEQSTLANKRTPTATTSRRGTSTSNVDHIERQLPSREGINQSNISDRFVEFIMYCNPLAPENLDKVALVRSFNAVPKSDGKVFQTWTLYQLVDKHYAGEIRTWTKLAQKLGVVRTPEASPQKIQQYAVRLKKWMASVHVDAYFDYLLSRPNDYYQLPQRNPTDASDDESDVVLKLIKRAGSKRQKRKYTRRNTNTSNTSANDDGTTNPEGISRGDTTELDDQFESEDVDEGADKHRGKRVRASYSDEASEEEDDKDPWAEMDIDGDDEEPERPSESTGTNQRRKSVVQFALIEPKNGSNIPTPNPSPTTALPVMSLSSGNITGNKRVLSHSGTAGTQLRWRISTGPVVKSSADESYLTTSPSSSQKDLSKKKQEPVQTLPPGQTVLDLRQPPMNPPLPMVRPARSFIPNEQQQQQQQFTDGKNYAEMLMPSVFPSNDKETINMLQKNLVSAIGMLEDSQRKIKMLNDIVRQREDDVRQRVVRALKNEVNTVIEKFQ